MAAALREQGEKLVADLIADHKFNRRARAQFLTRRIPQSEELRILLRQIRHLKNRPNLAPKAMADMGPLKDGYAYYAMLSADAAHPSIDSLNRYVEENVGGGRDVCNIVLHPEYSETEMIYTVHLACRALIGVSAMVYSIIGGPPDEEFDHLIKTMHLGKPSHSPTALPGALHW
jgi:hypothetical protein